MTDEQSKIRIAGETLLARKIRWTKIAMIAERVWLNLWPPILVVAAFIISALFEVWSFAGPITHRLALALFLIAFIASFYPLLSVRWPSSKAALKRLDKFSSLPHQPAEAFKDNLDPRVSSSETRTLWHNFKVRLVEKIRQLRVKPPKPETAAKDPFALRMLALLAIAVGLFIQGGNPAPLIDRAFALPPFVNINNLRVDAWVSPPSYTDAAPFIIEDGSKPLVSTQAALKSNSRLGETGKKNARAPHKAPANAILTIRINGKNASKVQIASLHHNKKSPTKKDIGKKSDTKLETAKKTTEKKTSEVKTTKSDGSEKSKESKEFQIKLTQSDKIKLKIDEIPLRNWEFEIQPDQPPVIGLTDLPKPAASGALTLNYRVADDYGVLEAKAEIKDVTFGKEVSKKPFTEATRPLGEPPIFTLNLPKVGVKAGKGKTFKDLTGHPWAGLTANLSLLATDEGGNTGKSPSLKMTLPEYKFTKELAKIIINIRKQLIITPQNSRIIALSLNDLTRKEKLFENDKTLYLGLRIAERRLRYIKERAEKEKIASMLYELARRVEDGELSKAERALRAAEDALREALQKNASSEEIQKRINELRKALQNYMQALARQQKNQNPGDKSGERAQTLNQKDLERMLKNIEKLAKSGSKDLARQMLSQMQNMLENIKRGRNAEKQPQGPQGKELEKLGELLRKQQKLMDKTFEKRRQANEQRRRDRENQRQSQQQRQSNQNGRNNQKGKGQKGQQGLNEQQQALRQELQKLMKQLGERRGEGIQPLDNAARAMGQAQQHLEENQLNNALSQEGQALEQMQQGADQLAKEMQEQQGTAGGKNARKRDPLGRPEGSKGMDTSNKTNVPDEIDIQRAREILRNLQDRLSDPNRPTPEIQYIERLLKRF